MICCQVLRSAGYYSHALEIARAANEPFWYLEILLEDQGNYDDGIKYVFKLPRRQAADAMKKYGKVLVTHRSRDSTGCLMKLCVPEQSQIEGAVDWLADFNPHKAVLFLPLLASLIRTINQRKDVELVCCVLCYSFQTTW